MGGRVSRRRAFAFLCGGLALFQSAQAGAQSLAEALARQGATCPERIAPWPSQLSFVVMESEGLRILVVTGGIAQGDSERLNQFIRRAGRIDEVWLDSPGGNAAEGPHLGRVIRAARLATRIPAGFQCISACTLAFLGGMVRRVDPGGAYGVHTFYSGGSYQEVIRLLTLPSAGAERVRQLRIYLHAREQSNALLALDWQRYTQEMGISRNFLSEEVASQRSIVLTTEQEILQMQQRGVPVETIARSLQTYHCPSDATLRRFNVINTSD